MADAATLPLTALAAMDADGEVAASAPAIAMDFPPAIATGTAAVSDPRSSASPDHPEAMAPAPTAESPEATVQATVPATVPAESLAAAPLATDSMVGEPTFMKMTELNLLSPLWLTLLGRLAIIYEKKCL